MNKYRRQIAKIDEKIEELRVKKKSLELEMMLSCTHPINERFQVEYGAHYSNSLPYQFCCLCGFGEEGWRTALFFKDSYNLEFNLPRMNGEQARKHSVKILTREDMDALEYPNREKYMVRAKELEAFSLPKELQRK